MPAIGPLWPSGDDGDGDDDDDDNGDDDDADDDDDDDDGLTDARTLTASSDPTPSQASPHGGNEAGPGR